MFSGNYACVYDSIGLIRRYLNYKTDYPYNLSIEKPAGMKFICENYYKWFPKHSPILFIINPSLQEAIDKLEIKPPLYQNYESFQACIHSLTEKTWNVTGVWMYDYIIRQANLSHTVVGFPSFDQGMFGQYAIFVMKDYQLALL